MDLRDRLKRLAEKSGVNGKICKFGNIYISLEQETREAFECAMTSGATTMDITRALNEDGIKVRREYVAEKRKCFREENLECCLKKEEII
jgi:hypothetical protein